MAFNHFKKSFLKNENPRTRRFCFICFGKTDSFFLVDNENEINLCRTHFDELSTIKLFFFCEKYERVKNYIKSLGYEILNSKIKKLK